MSYNICGTIRMMIDELKTKEQQYVKPHINIANIRLSKHFDTINIMRITSDRMTNLNFIVVHF